MRAFHSFRLRECKHFTLLRRLAIMRAKRISFDEQLKLITECRQSGLSDYQWCQANEINPGTFYNWISRLRKKGRTIPDSVTVTEPTAAGLQEVVKVDLIPSHEFMPGNPITNDCPVHDPAAMTRKDPVIEILLGNSTIRLFQGTDRELIETTLRCLGGNAYAG